MRTILPCSIVLLMALVFSPLVTAQNARDLSGVWQLAPGGGVQNGVAAAQSLFPTQVPYVTVESGPVSGIQRYYQVNSASRSNAAVATLQIAPGTWWNNTNTASVLNLTKDQQKKMDDIFQQFRLKLIDLNAALSKEELILDPLIAAERLDELKILAQIDRIAQARAELEKANSRMLLGIRQSLTMEQWSQIQSSPGIFRNAGTRK